MCEVVMNYSTSGPDTSDLDEKHQSIMDKLLKSVLGCPVFTLSGVISSASVLSATQTVFLFNSGEVRSIELTQLQSSDDNALL